MALRNELTAAIEDTTGVKARALFPAASTVQQALKAAKDRFDACSFRSGVTPAWHDAPGASGFYIGSALGYDSLHSGWLGQFRRLSNLTLVTVAEDVGGYSSAATLLNGRIAASGRHDGQRCPRSVRRTATTLRRFSRAVDCRRQVPA
jgi:hypothetical protein